MVSIRRGPRAAIASANCAVNSTVSCARVAATRPAVVAVVVIAVVFAAVFGVRLLRARDAGSVVAPAAAQLAASSPTGTGASGPGQADAPVAVSATPGSAPAAAPGGAGGAAGAGTIIVHVVGQVRHAGVVELPPGSRVVDAIDKAGGAGRKADLSAVNLARVVVDGEQIVVPKPGEATAAAPASSGGGSGGGSGGTAGPTAAGSAKVNLNTADLAAFDSLPGVGPVLAGRILAWRTEHGRFTSIDELAEVSGIGEKVLANLTPLVTL